MSAEVSEITSTIRATAAAYGDPALGSLDAIHLATAHTAGLIAPLTSLVTYDSRLRHSAEAIGITTVSPGLP